MKRQIDTKPVGQAARPFLSLDCCCGMEREDGRALSDRLYHRVDAVYLEPDGFERHANPLPI